jgi:hypothetical protein
MIGLSLFVSITVFTPAVIISNPVIYYLSKGPYSLGLFDVITIEVCKVLFRSLISTSID